MKGYNIKWTYLLCIINKCTRILWCTYVYLFELILVSFDFLFIVTFVATYMCTIVLYSDFVYFPVSYDKKHLVLIIIIIISYSKKSSYELPQEIIIYLIHG